MPTPRKDNRPNDQLRPFSIQRGEHPYAYGSALINMGNTRVSCTVSMEDKVPPFLRGSGQGWITAEYGMLPTATHTRGRREAAVGRSGRTYEIQRLIGRSLRMMMDLKKLGERTLRVDCDVLLADGGTRCASITGAALALRDAVEKLHKEGLVPEAIQVTPLAAVSVGMVDDKPRLDLDYDEDSNAGADANFVMTGEDRWIEMQCTAEGRPLSQDEFDQMAKLARSGIQELLKEWHKAT